MTEQERYNQQKGYSNRYINQLIDRLPEEVLQELHHKFYDDFQKSKEYQELIDSAAQDFKTAAENELINLLNELKL